MTNKEFFKTLDKNIQMDIIQTLRSYNKVHIEFYYGEHHATTNYTLMAKYPSDYKVLNEFEAKEFDFEGHNYELEWYDYWNEKERKGEKNEIINGRGKWQLEFENLWKLIIERAYNKYIEG